MWPIMKASTNSVKPKHKATATTCAPCKQTKSRFCRTAAQYRSWEVVEVDLLFAHSARDGCLNENALQLQLEQPDEQTIGARAQRRVASEDARSHSHTIAISASEAVLARACSSEMQVKVSPD